MAGYAKVFSDIVHSTVWREDVYTKVVWITMLVMSDRHGLVMSSIPGLADAAKVSLEQCLSALEVLSSPDKYSRTKEFEGRRVDEVDGGWLLLNYEKFRARKDDEEQRIRTVERVRRHRQRLADSTKTDLVTENVTVMRGNPIAEASSSATTDSLPVVIPNKTETVSGKKPDASPLREKNKITKSEAIEALRFLNDKTGKAYREVDTNLKLIESILKSGVSLEDIRTVTMRKVRDWRDNPKMSEYLRPSTLYRRSNFEQYLGQVILPEEQNG